MTPIYIVLTLSTNRWVHSRVFRGWLYFAIFRGMFQLQYLAGWLGVQDFRAQHVQNGEVGTILEKMHSLKNWILKCIKTHSYLYLSQIRISYVLFINKDYLLALSYIIYWKILKSLSETILLSESDYIQESNWYRENCHFPERKQFSDSLQLPAIDNTLEYVHFLKCVQFSEND